MVLECGKCHGNEFHKFTRGTQGFSFTFYTFWDDSIMKQCVLLCQTQSDTEALLPAAAVLRSENYQAVWLLYSPAVLVDTKAAEAEHQKNIDGLAAAIARCAAAEDFDGAKAYKVQRDAALLDRVGKVKDAWKAIAPFEQGEAEKRLFEPFMKALDDIAVRVQRLPDHYEPSQFIDALNSIRKGWHAPCVPPSFVLTWVSTLAGNAAPQRVADVLENIASKHPLLAAAVEGVKKDIESVRKEAASQPAEKPHNPPAPPSKEDGRKMSPRRKQLLGMSVPQLGDEAIRLGFTPSGNRMQIVKQIMTKEAEKTAEAPVDVAAY